MSVASQQFLTHSVPTSRFKFYFKTSNHIYCHQPVNSRHVIRTSSGSFFAIPPDSKSRYLQPVNSHGSSSLAPETDDGFDFDSILSIAELVCLFSSTVVGIGFVIKNSVLGSKSTLLGLIGSRVLALGVVGLLCGVWIGAVVRRRQWRWICTETVRGKANGSVNLVGRIEKVEEDLRSSATIIRVLSRQLEKLGIRFRVTRKALKEPISQVLSISELMVFAIYHKAGLWSIEEKRQMKVKKGFDVKCVRRSLSSLKLEWKREEIVEFDLFTSLSWSNSWERVKDFKLENVILIWILLGGE